MSLVPLLRVLLRTLQHLRRLCVHSLDGRSQLLADFGGDRLREFVEMIDRLLQAGGVVIVGRGRRAIVLRIDRVEAGECLAERVMQLVDVLHRRLELRALIIAV